MSSEDIKDSKKPRISKEREALLKTVENLGISFKDSDGKELSDSELLSKTVKELQRANDQLASKMADTEEDALKKYSSSIDHYLKNGEFITRLKSLGVPFFYLHIFRDEDDDLTDKELWEIINKSGINPFDNVAQLFAERKSLEFPTKKRRRR